MPPRKRSRGEFTAAEEATRGCPLPADLLLEIFARADAATLIRCSASCRSLRRDILLPDFIRRVCNIDGAVPPRLLGFLCLDLGLTSMAPPPSFSLAHPAAASFSETHLAPALCRLAGYEPLTSRNGLVLLRRICWTGTRHEMTLCVYDPMTGKGTFFPGPPDATRGRSFGHSYDRYKHVLLTPADGVASCSSSFLLFAADFSGLRDGSRSVTVRTCSPSPDSGGGGGAWSPVTFFSHSREPWYATREPRDSVAVLRGGFVHFLISESHEEQCYIFTYNVGTAASGCIELPAEVRSRASRKLHLTSSSPCGRQLSLLAADKFKVSVWLLLSAGGASCSWARQAVIDTAMTVHDVMLKWRHCPWPTGVNILGSGARSGAVILLPRPWSEFEKAEKGIIVLDLETKQMRVVSKKKHAFVYEVDMASRLAAMKIF